MVGNIFVLPKNCSLNLNFYLIAIYLSGLLFSMTLESIYGRPDRSTRPFKRTLNNTQNRHHNVHTGSQRANVQYVLAKITTTTQHFQEATTHLPNPKDMP